jgi:hypothetical protein
MHGTVKQPALLLTISLMVCEIAVAQLLIFMGDPDDRLVLELGTTSHSSDADNDWVYFVACALAEPSS